MSAWESDEVAVSSFDQGVLLREDLGLLDEAQSLPVTDERFAEATEYRGRDHLLEDDPEFVAAAAVGVLEDRRETKGLSTLVKDDRRLFVDFRRSLVPVTVDVNDERTAKVLVVGRVETDDAVAGEVGFQDGNRGLGLLHVSGLAGILSTIRGDVVPIDVLADDEVHSPEGQVPDHPDPRAGLKTGTEVLALHIHGTPRCIE